MEWHSLFLMAQGLEHSCLMKDLLNLTFNYQD